MGPSVGRIDLEDPFRAATGGREEPLDTGRFALSGIVELQTLSLLFCMVHPS